MLKMMINLKNILRGQRNVRYHDRFPSNKKIV